VKYASLDLETTGLDHTWCQILEIGVVIDDLDLPQDDNPPTFHAYVGHQRIQGEPYALNLNRDIIGIIAEGKHPDIVTPEQAGPKLVSFLQQHFKKKVTAAGKNFQGFDKKFLDATMPDIDFKFHHRTFDPVTNFYRKGDQQLPDLTECLKRANITLPFQLHTAVDDAKAIIALLRTIHKFEK